MPRSTKRVGKNLILRNGVYYLKIKIDGRQIWRSTGYGEGALKSAEKKADEMKVQLRNQKNAPEEEMEVPTFGEWVNTYKDTYSPDKRAAWRDDQILMVPLEMWKRIPLDEITQSMAKRFLQRRLLTCAGSTVNRERGTVQAVFERAIEEGLIDRNPFRYLDREEEGPRIRVLTPPNELKLRSVLTPQYQRWLTFMLGTGLRLAEAQSITLVEVDPVKELIQVPAEAAKFGKPREVPLRPDVWQAVQEQAEANAGKLWHANQQNYRQLFSGKTERLKIGTRHVPGACERAGIPHLSPHDLRHTFATRYLQAGGDIYKLSKILGHSSVSISERFYAHLESRDLVEASRGVWKKQGVA